MSPEALSKPLVAGAAMPEFSLEAAAPADAPATARPAAARPTPSFMAAAGQSVRPPAGVGWCAPECGRWALRWWHRCLPRFCGNERDRIAHSQSKPCACACLGLQWLLGCRVEPLRRVDALVIESSSFNKALSQAYTLQFTVRNTGAVPVAMPAVELTLTDVQDRVLLRRVLQAKEFAGPKVAVPAGASVAANLPVQVRPVVRAGVDCGLPPAGLLPIKKPGALRPPGLKPSVSRLGLAGRRKWPGGLRVQCGLSSRSSGSGRRCLAAGAFGSFLRSRLLGSFLGGRLFGSGLLRSSGLLGRSSFLGSRLFRWCSLLGWCSFLGGLPSSQGRLLGG